jgi:hypothetical protein
MNYQDSIRAITTAYANYLNASHWGNDADIGEALQTLHRLKAEHKAKYGALVRINGEWI